MPFDGQLNAAARAKGDRYAEKLTRREQELAPR